MACNIRNMAGKNTKKLAIKMGIWCEQSHHFSRFGSPKRRNEIEMGKSPEGNSMGERTNEKTQIPYYSPSIARKIKLRSTC